MLHVLLVEDSPADVMMVREAMRKSPVPADMVIAYDGEQASELLGSRLAFNLVILDLNVPKYDGHRLLREHRLPEGAPVVIFTGSEKPSDKDKALALGARDYVLKPRKFDEFVGTVQEILRRYAAS